jgi:acyl dehydratase
MGVITKDQLLGMVGQEYGLSDWIEISQARIDAFAEITEDHQFIHTDPTRAAETPFGGTIAHGFLTLSMLSAMIYQTPDVADTLHGVNYGFDKVRFLSPVPAGARIRGRFTLKDARESRPGEVTTVMSVSIEIEGQDRPALAAEWIGRRYIGEAK